MAQQATPTRSHAGLSTLAWDLLAEQMLLVQLAGSIARVQTGRPIVRVCRHCGTLASEAALQGEPICNRGGMVGAHSYVDFDVRDLAAARRLELAERIVAIIDDADAYEVDCGHGSAVRSIAGLAGELAGLTVAEPVAS